MSYRQLNTQDGCPKEKSAWGVEISIEIVIEFGVDEQLPRENKKKGVMVKSWLIGKDSDAGRDWGQEEKRMTEDEMAGWHHWLDGRESEWTPGVGDGQGGLVCCDSWGRKESDTIEQLNWTDGRQLPYFGSGTMKRKSRPHCHCWLMLWFSVALDSWVASHQPRPR